MPLATNDFRAAQDRVYAMFMDTVRTIEEIERHADSMYGDRTRDVRAAINECLDDLVRNTQSSGQKHPEVLVYEATLQNFQKAGFYGAQLNIKERQVKTANTNFRERLAGGVRSLWKRPFKKWISTINNFLGSFAPATGLGEALKELKDCLSDELPDDDDE
jgi:hypothetical protein